MLHTDPVFAVPTSSFQEFARVIRRVALVILASVATWLGAPVSRAELADSALPPSLLSELRRIADEERAPGLQVAVLSPDGRTAEATFGLADMETGVAVTPRTVFRAGSVSKLFTATLIMQQVEHGALALDENVNVYLPPDQRIRDPQGVEVPVTIRELLSHRSGLPLLGAGVSRLRVLGFLLGLVAEPSVDAYLAHGLVLRDDVPRTLRYSDDGYILLGWLSARLAGTSFPAHARIDLLEPLGMASSDFDRHALPQGVQLTTPYKPDGDGWKKAREYGTPWPSGALYTTAGDLLRFARMVLNGGIEAGRRILEPASLAEMTRLQSQLTPVLESGYGFGFRLTTYRGRRLLCHEGETAGDAARLCIDPAAHVAVAVLANVGQLAAAMRASNVVLDEVLGLGARPTARVVGDGELRVWTGRYRLVDAMTDALSWLEPWLRFQVAAHDGGLRMEVPGFGPAVLEPTNDPARFVVRGGRGDGETFVFVRGDDGRVDGYVAILHIARASP
jgi:CubicO group peptidase (beta-lactamase class C family)